MKLDIACGGNKRPGFKGVDLIPLEGVDYVWDLEKFPWEPFKDNSVEEVYVSHYAEHTKDLIKFMDEIWRICKHDAKVTILGPYYTSIRAWQDPTHTRVLSENLWFYFSNNWRQAPHIKDTVGHYPIKSDFNIEKIYFSFNPPWDKKPDEARAFAQTHYWNVIADIIVELRAVK